MERRDPTRPDRRKILYRAGGRRASDQQVPWTTTQLAAWIGMSADFVLREIYARELVASQFGREYRIPVAEVKRYLQVKAFPVPDTL